VLPCVDVLDQPGFVKPLDHLWARANGPTLDAKYRDALMVKLLPYFHPRLGLYVSRHLHEDISRLSDDDLLRQIVEIVSEPGEALARQMAAHGWVRVRTTETIQ